MPGLRTAPASLPMHSTRSAAQRRRRGCGSGMGSRSLTSPKPLAGWPRTLLAKVKQQRRALAGILKSGVDTFSGNRDGKEDPFGAACALVIRAVAVGQALRQLLSFALRALGAARAAPKQSLEKSTLIMACVVG